MTRRSGLYHRVSGAWFVCATQSKNDLERVTVALRTPQTAYRRRDLCWLVRQVKTFERLRVCPGSPGGAA